MGVMGACRYFHFIAMKYRHVDDSSKEGGWEIGHMVCLIGVTSLGCPMCLALGKGSIPVSPLVQGNVLY